MDSSITLTPKEIQKLIGRVETSLRNRSAGAVPVPARAASSAPATVPAASIPPPAVPTFPKKRPASSRLFAVQADPSASSQQAFAVASSTLGIGQLGMASNHSVLKEETQLHACSIVPGDVPLAEEQTSGSDHDRARKRRKKRRRFQLMIKGIPEDISIQEIQHHFRQYGQLTDFRYSFTDDNLGFASMTYLNKDDHRRATLAAEGLQFKKEEQQAK